MAGGAPDVTVDTGAVIVAVTGGVVGRVIVPVSGMPTGRTCITASVIRPGPRLRVRG